MYQLLNEHIDAVISNVIDVERDLKPYNWLMLRFQKGPIAADAEFQQTYRRYWTMTGARLSPEFCAGYFRLMDRLRSHRPLEIDEILRTLHELPAHRNGRRCLHLSFASKLMHTLDPHRPMYDSFVRNFFFLPETSSGQPFETRLDHLVRSYRFLESEYGRVLAGRLLPTAIDRFRASVDCVGSWTDQRIVDVLIWSFSKFLRSGALRDGTVRYS